MAGASSAAEVWLIVDGTRLRVGPEGVLIGRASSCDLLLESPLASRHHALVHRDGDAVRLVVMGREGVTLNGSPTTGGDLGDGDRIELPGATLVIALDEGDALHSSWFVAGPTGPAVRVSRTGWVIGAGGDLAPDGVPAAALTLEPGPDRLHVTGACDWHRNGHPITAGVRVAALPGDALQVGGVALHVARRGAQGAETTQGADRPAERVVLQFLPRGGRIAVTVAGVPMTAFVPERRFALLVSLLQPAAPHQAGEVIPDEVVLRSVWPRQPHKSRVDLNVLVARVRATLDAAGIPGEWVARPGSGGTRFVLGPSAVVDVS